MLRKAATVSNTPQQLSLNIHLQADATFVNYWVSPDNVSNSAIAVKALTQFCDSQGDLNLLLWGTTGCGLTHLLQACSHASRFPVAYLPLKDALDLPPAEVCCNLENAPLLCIDDIETLVGNIEWEQAFFHLYNRLRDNGHRLLMATHTNPKDLAFELPDLRSRVLGSVIYHVDLIAREQKAAALIMRARERGMVMSDEVASFVIKQAPRRMKDLFATLDKLDAASLQAQKKLSLRFVKQVLGA